MAWAHIAPRPRTWLYGHKTCICVLYTIYSRLKYVYIYTRIHLVCVPVSLLAEVMIFQCTFTMLILLGCQLGDDFNVKLS